MTTTIRDITPSMFPLSKRYSLSNITKLLLSKYVYGLSPSRNWIIGAPKDTASNVLQVSNDDGATWSNVHTFDHSGTGTEQIQGVMQWPDGEISVATGRGATSGESRIYRSIGWGDTLAQKQAATWGTDPYRPRGGSFAGVWGFHQQCVGTNGKAICSTYAGGKTNSGSNDAAEILKARYSFITLDQGKTWALRYDIYMQPQAPLPGGVHIHGCLYYEPWDMFLFTFGDNTGAGQTVAGPNNLMVAFSYDDGATWSYLPQDQATMAGVAAQFTTAFMTDKALVLVPDDMAQNIMLTLPITGYRQFGTAYLMTLPSRGYKTVGKAAFRAGPAFPILFGYNTSGEPITNTQGSTPPSMFASSDGLSSYPLYIDTDATAEAVFAGGIVGPTLRNKIIAEYNGGLFVATLVAPTT